MHIRRKILVALFVLAALLAVDALVQVATGRAVFAVPIFACAVTTAVVAQRRWRFTAA
jgi:hypothetical protein